MCLMRHGFAETPKVQASRNDNDLMTRQVHYSSNYQLWSGDQLAQDSQTLHQSKPTLIPRSTIWPSCDRPHCLLCLARHQHLFLFGSYSYHHLGLREDSIANPLSRTTRHLPSHSPTIGSVRDHTKSKEYDNQDPILSSRRRGRRIERHARALV